jgi:hypothetical protein
MTLKANKPHHQKNILTVVVLVDLAVGVKDRRIDTVFHPGLRSPILHPYKWIIMGHGEKG